MEQPPAPRSERARSAQAVDDGPPGDGGDRDDRPRGDLRLHPVRRPGPPDRRAPLVDRTRVDDLRPRVIPDVCGDPRPGNRAAPGWRLLRRRGGQLLRLDLYGPLERLRETHVSDLALDPRDDRPPGDLRHGEGRGERRGPPGPA